MIPALRMRQVAKRYRAGVRGCSISVAALRGADLDVAPGEAVVVTGPPAAGKSTLLLCAAGLLRPDAGEVSWFGVGPLCRTAPPGVAYVADRGAHYGFLTVREAVEYHATLHDVSAAGRRRGRAVESALDRTGLAWAAGRRVSMLERGALRRLALAQALVRSPRLLLLDETLSDLSAEERRPVRELLGALTAEGASIVIAARERAAVAESAFALAARVVALEQGVVRDPAPGAALPGRPAARVAERSARGSVDPGVGGS